MVALSVSISAITSPDLTASPSFFSHLARGEGVRKVEREEERGGVNKALVAFLACSTLAVAATSVATNLARVSR